MATIAGVRDAVSGPAAAAAIAAAPLPVAPFALPSARASPSPTRGFQPLLETGPAHGPSPPETPGH